MRTLASRRNEETLLVQDASGVGEFFVAKLLAIGPICAGGLYQIHSPLSPLFSASVFFAVLLILVFYDRRPVS